VSNFALGTCAFLYLCAALDLLIKGKLGLSLAFFAYAVANVGFIMSAMSKV
jgi:hypothetical protein